MLDITPRSGLSEEQRSTIYFTARNVVRPKPLPQKQAVAPLFPLLLKGLEMEGDALVDSIW